MWSTGGKNARYSRASETFRNRLSRAVHTGYPGHIGTPVDSSDPPDNRFLACEGQAAVLDRYLLSFVDAVVKAEAESGIADIQGMPLKDCIDGGTLNFILYRRVKLSTGTFSSGCRIKDHNSLVNPS